MAGADKTHLCQYERERFPADEFEQTEEYGLVHNRDPRHTARGEVIVGPPPPPEKPVIPGPGRVPGPMAPRRDPEA